MDKFLRKNPIYLNKQIHKSIWGVFLGICHWFVKHWDPQNEVLLENAVCFFLFRKTCCVKSQAPGVLVGKCRPGDEVSQPHSNYWGWFFELDTRSTLFPTACGIPNIYIYVYTCTMDTPPYFSFKPTQTPKGLECSSMWKKRITTPGRIKWSNELKPQKKD